jgi:hypothetical protein
MWRAIVSVIGCARISRRSTPCILWDDVWFDLCTEADVASPTQSAPAVKTDVTKAPAPVVAAAIVNPPAPAAAAVAAESNPGFLSAIFDRNRTFKPKKKPQQGTKQFTLTRTMNASMRATLGGVADMRDVVKCPPQESVDEWYVTRYPGVRHKVTLLRDRKNGL